MIPSRGPNGRSTSSGPGFRGGSDYDGRPGRSNTGPSGGSPGTRRTATGGVSGRRSPWDSRYAPPRRALRRNRTERGLRIVTPDRPGFGRSTPWPERRPTDAGTWFDALLTEAGVSSAPVAAFSGGAADALALAATRGDLVDRLDLAAAAVPPSIGRDTPRLQRVLGRAAVRTPCLLATGLRGQAWVAACGPPSFVVGQYTDESDEIPVAVAKLELKDFVESAARTRKGS